MSIRPLTAEEERQFAYIVKNHKPTTHPEMLDGEIFLMNVTEEEFLRFEKSAPEWLKTLRLGQIAHDTNSTTVVPGFRPMLGKRIENRMDEDKAGW